MHSTLSCFRRNKLCKSTSPLFRFSIKDKGTFYQLTIMETPESKSATKKHLRHGSSGRGKLQGLIMFLVLFHILPHLHYRFHCPSIIPVSNVFYIMHLSYSTRQFLTSAMQVCLTTIEY